MSRPILGGSADQSTVIRFLDSTTGLPVAAVTSATAGLAIWYRRAGAVVVAITPIGDLAGAGSAHTDKAIFYLSDGLVRVDLPDAAVLAGATDVTVGGSATGMVAVPSCHPIDAPVDVRLVNGTEATVGTAPPTAAEILTEFGTGSTLTACATATGFSTHSAADVLTAFGTGSALTACVTATGFSTHSAADVATALGTGSTLTALATVANQTTIIGYVDCLPVTLTVPTANENADALLARNVSNVEATAGEHTLCTVVLAALESSVSGTTWTIRKTGGTTHATKTVTSSASADPITGVT